MYQLQLSKVFFGFVLFKVLFWFFNYARMKWFFCLFRRIWSCSFFSRLNCFFFFFVGHFGFTISYNGRENAGMPHDGSAIDKDTVTRESRVYQKIIRWPFHTDHVPYCVIDGSNVIRRPHWVSADLEEYFFFLWSSFLCLLRKDACVDRGDLHLPKDNLPSPLFDVHLDSQ